MSKNDTQKDEKMHTVTTIKHTNTKLAVIVETSTSEKGQQQSVKHVNLDHKQLKVSHAPCSKDFGHHQSRCWPDQGYQC